MRAAARVFTGFVLLAFYRGLIFMGIQLVDEIHSSMGDNYSGPFVALVYLGGIVSFGYAARYWIKKTGG